ncbi:MAG: hypothetical protein LBP24_05445, partial [Coriobacteriales bacterium]|nr:hypothetical protein [Coriobacteriales bacterium]
MSQDTKETVPLVSETVPPVSETVPLVSNRRSWFGVYLLDMGSRYHVPRKSKHEREGSPMAYLSDIEIA